MENINLKNMVKLRNLPSNLVEEAYVVFKSNKDAKKFASIEQQKLDECVKKLTPKNNYAVKEAELVVSDYILKIKQGNSNLKEKNSQIKKNKKLKKYLYITTLIALIEMVLLIIV